MHWDVGLSCGDGVELHPSRVFRDVFVIAGALVSDTGAGRAHHTGDEVNQFHTQVLHHTHLLWTFTHLTVVQNNNKKEEEGREKNEKKHIFAQVCGHSWLGLGNWLPRHLLWAWFRVTRAVLHV